MNEIKFKGKLVVVTAPSGAGKSTIVRHLLSEYDILDFSVSATTRKKRDYEVDGLDYYFYSEKQFKELIEKDAFVEWEEVYINQFYGTLHSEIKRIWGSHRHILFDIDVKGALKIKDKFGNRCKTLFIMPPSIEILIHRLSKRKTESQQSLQNRIRKISRELGFKNRFDEIIFNDLLEVALKDAEIVVESFLGLDSCEKQAIL